MHGARRPKLQGLKRAILEVNAARKREQEAALAESRSAKAELAQALTRLEEQQTAAKRAEDEAGATVARELPQCRLRLRSRRSLRSRRFVLLGREDPGCRWWWARRWWRPG